MDLCGALTADTGADICSPWMRRLGHSTWEWAQGGTVKEKPLSRSSGDRFPCDSVSVFFEISFPFDLSSFGPKNGAVVVTAPVHRWTSGRSFEGFGKGNVGSGRVLQLQRMETVTVT